MKNFFSIVIPIYNEEENIKKLFEEICDTLKKNEYEIIFINDCSNDGSENILKSISNNTNYKYFNHSVRLGQSAAILTGIKNSSYNNIVTIDGDGQNNPQDIINLINLYFNNKKYALVSGLRKKRQDNIIKIFSSKIANYIRSFILNDDCTDTGCSLKIFNKEIFLSFEYFSGIHRFIPSLFYCCGYKVAYINVDHRKRKKGKSKYGIINRLFIGIRDLLKVKRIIKKYNNNGFIH